MARFGLGDHVFHDLGNVLDIEAGAVEGAVGGDRTEHLADGLDSAFADGLCALDHQPCRAHANNQAVTPTVKRNGGVFHCFIGGGCSNGQKASAEPFHEVVGGNVVG